MFTNFEIMSSKSKVYFFFENVSITLRHRGELKKSIERLLKRKGKNLSSLNYIFCSDNRLREINRQFLNHDYFTDIITFDLSETKDELVAEVYISVDRVRDNARTHRTTLASETLRVIYHGALHLCGYKDKTLKEKKIMRDREDKLINLFLR